MSTTIFNIAGSHSNDNDIPYVINGINNPPLSMYRGKTYTFNLSDIIGAEFHPLYISTTSEFSINTIYNNGVTGNGSEYGPLIFSVPLNAPSTLYYVCNFHQCGNVINITDEPSGEPIPCYSKGTLILTNQGYIKVEDIKEGDIVVREGIIKMNSLEKNTDTKEAPIIWIRKFKPKILNSNSRPIRITKNAFGEECPFVDLYVSPNHSLFINDKMVTTHNLINGETIYQDNECESVEYYHLECHRHSAIYANGVLAETYSKWHREVFDVDDVDK